MENQLRQVFHALRYNYRLPDKVKITLHVDEDKAHYTFPDRIADAYVTTKGNVVDIYIATKGHWPINLVSSVGHEYKHVLQRFVDKTSKTIAKDMYWGHPLEMEAQKFGNLIAEEWRVKYGKDLKGK